MPHDVDSLLSVIQTLRRELDFFKNHHKCCSIALPASPPVDDETEPSAELQIIPFLAQSVEVSKPRDTIPRWRQIANKILTQVTPEQWNERREYFGLHNEATWLTTAIFGAPVQGSGRQAESQLGAGIMISAQAYATVTKATQKSAEMFRQIHSFMELVLVSLCAVLEFLNYPVDEINETMRICLSDSDDINLKRLRHGAIWVSRTIVDMYKAGIGDKGSEFFFIYGVSTSKYSVLADNIVSGPHFVHSLLKLKDSRYGPQPEAQTFTPLCIPAYIQVLVGDAIPLSQICLALGYGEQYVTESITQLCEKYRKLALGNGSDSLTVPLLVSKKRKRSSNESASAERRQRSSNDCTSVAEGTTVNRQNLQVNRTVSLRIQQFQPSLDCGSEVTFGPEDNGVLLSDAVSRVVAPSCREADSQCPWPEGIGREPSSSNATNACGGLTYFAGSAHTEERHSLSQESEAEIQEDSGANSDPRSDAERLEAENNIWAGDLPVRNMGWENMFDAPEVGSLGWEDIPLEVGDSLGWESMFKSPDVSSMGWEPMVPSREVDDTG